MFSTTAGLILVVLVLIAAVLIFIRRAKTGPMTPYGRLVRKPFGDGFEMIPEYVHHLADTAALRLNQFVYVDAKNPWKIEAWCTQSPEKGVPGVWDGPRKLRTMKLVNGGVYDEFVLLETNVADDNTVGVVGALVCVLPDGRQLVAVNKHQKRRGAFPEGLIESKRHRHGSTDIMPKATDGAEMVIKVYGTDQIGLLLTNTACIHAVNEDNIRLALVRGELLIAYADHEPALNAPFEWMDLPEYMFLTMDDHAQAVIGRAIVAGYLSTPSGERVQPVLDRLPAFVAEKCGK